MTVEVPEGWRVEKLGELGTFANGINKGKEDFGFGVPFFNLQDIFGEQSVSDFPKGLVNASPNEIDRYKVATGDVLFVRSSVKPEGVGKTAVVLKDLAETIYSGFIIKFRPNEEIFETPYLKYAFYENGFRKRLLAKSTINANTNINQKALATLPLPIPPLPEQKKIAEVLSSVDEAIAATKAVINQTKQVKKGLLQTLLTKGIGHTNFKQTPLGEIPESWEVLAFEDVSERITYGFTNPMPTTEEGPWMITAANVRDGKIDYKTCRKTSESDYKELLTEKSRPTVGTVLITKDGTLGRIAIVDREGVCINQSVASLLPSQNVSSRFLFHVLQSPQMQKTLLGEAGGTSVKHIYITKLAKTLLPVPPKAEQEQIIERLDAAETSIELQETKLEQLQTLKSGLMSDLLTGRKRVEV